MQLQRSSYASDGKNLKIAIMLPRFNDELGKKLLEETKKTLLEKNISEKNIKIFRTPGALESPLAAAKIISSKKFNVIIALGIVIEGETAHFEHVCRETYNGLMTLMLKKKFPIIFGILTVKNKKQAQERIKNGKYYAESAIEMAHFMKNFISC